MAVSISPGIVGAQTDDATIEIEAGTASGYPTSRVSVALAPGGTMNAFELVLTYPPTSLRPVDTNPAAAGVQLDVDPRWSNIVRQEVDTERGTIRVVATSLGTNCTGPQRCPLFGIIWEPLEGGEFALGVSAVALSSGADVLEQVSALAGSIVVPDRLPAATSAPGLETPASAETSEPTSTLPPGIAASASATQSVAGSQARGDVPNDLESGGGQAGWRGWMFPVALVGSAVLTIAGLIIGRTILPRRATPMPARSSDVALPLSDLDRTELQTIFDRMEALGTVVDEPPPGRPR